MRLQRRFKAAFEAYLESEMPKLREDVRLPTHSFPCMLRIIQHPGLRQNQMRDILFKQFQKAPENRKSPR